LKSVGFKKNSVATFRGPATGMNGIKFHKIDNLPGYYFATPEHLEGDDIIKHFALECRVGEPNAKGNICVWGPEAITATYTVA